MEDKKIDQFIKENFKNTFFSDLLNIYKRIEFKNYVGEFVGFISLANRPISRKRSYLKVVKFDTAQIGY